MELVLHGSEATIVEVKTWQIEERQVGRELSWGRYRLQNALQEYAKAVPRLALQVEE